MVPGMQPNEGFNIIELIKCPTFAAVNGYPKIIRPIVAVYGTSVIDAWRNPHCLFPQSTPYMFGAILKYHRVVQRNKKQGGEKMEIRNITAQGIRAALVRANADFEGNLDFNNFSPLNDKDTAYRIMLRVVDSHGKGARLSQGRTAKGNRRHMQFACWHAYGAFIDKVFEVAETATVKVNGQRYTKDTWTWEDRNIGSMMDPLMYSEACECQ